MDLNLLLKEVLLIYFFWNVYVSKFKYFDEKNVFYFRVEIINLKGGFLWKMEIALQK